MGIRCVVRARRDGVVFGCMAMLVATLGVAVVGRAATLDQAAMPTVETATFEVVQAKPIHDPLTYAKALPLDLLPYQQRTDKYFSIGTAFAVGHGRYVTSARVLMAGLDSLWGPPALRDSHGNVYPIDVIEKFGLRRDFAVFTVTGQPTGGAFRINEKLALNQPVYAVGNALDTGVVIRGGMYTSDTPEPQDGAWHWMRFSAAASPGNGGGPLLDQSGEVVGMVVGKSPNENLNFALPIARILAAPEGKAIMDVRSVARIAVMDTQQQGDFKATFALPMTLAAFYDTFHAQWKAYGDQQRKVLLAKESANLFPNGDGARHLLYLSVFPDAFPQLIARGSDGVSDRYQNDTPRFNLTDNGYVRVSRIGALTLVHVRRPDNVQAHGFYNDAKVRMDLLASAGGFKRKVGSEAVTVTSLGQPASQSVSVDGWQRRWHVAVWPLAFANMQVVAYELPVPDGCDILMREVPAADEYGALQDLAEITNFIYVSYDGLLAQWRQFLDERALLPAAFQHIHVDAVYGKRFSFDSPRLAFSYTPRLQPVNPDSRLWLGMRFYPDDGKVVWGAADAMVWANNEVDDTHITIQQFLQPPVGMDDDYLTSMWQKVSGRLYPYNGVPRLESDVMKVDSVMAPKSGGGIPAYLYTVFVGVQGQQTQVSMRDKLDLLMKHTTVKGS